MFTLIVLTERAFHIRQFEYDRAMQEAAETVVKDSEGEGLVAVFGYSPKGKMTIEHVVESE